MQYDTTLSTDTLERIITTIDPAASLRDARYVDGGHHIVYRLKLERPTGVETAYLKATPDDKPGTVNLDARLLAGIGSRSSIPVPDVIGSVDEHEDLPAPYALFETKPGTAYSRLELPAMPDDKLEQLAEQTGHWLAKLHALDAVEAYGFLTASGPRLQGERPPGDFTSITVAEPIQDWATCLENWSSGTLENLERTRFADVVSRVEPELDRQIQGVNGPFEPSLARIDNSIENILVDGGELTAFIDWEFTIAATPAYDLSCVAWSLAGGPYQFAVDAPDRRPLVREALIDGYRASPATGMATHRIIDQYRANRSCYELMSTLRSMFHLEDWYELFDLGDRVDAAAADLREELDERLAG